MEETGGSITRSACTSCKLEWTDKSYSRKEIFSEYLNFLKHLPKLITSEKKKNIEHCTI